MEEAPKSGDDMNEEAQKSREDKSEEAPRAQEHRSEEAPRSRNDRSERAPKARDDRNKEAPKARNNRSERAPKAHDDRNEEAPNSRDDRKEEAPETRDAQQILTQQGSAPAMLHLQGLPLVPLPLVCFSQQQHHPLLPMESRSLCPLSHLLQNRVVQHTRKPTNRPTNWQAKCTVASLPLLAPCVSASNRSLV